MSLIACTDPCVYQKDGYCSLSRAAYSGEASGSRCVNFVPVQSKQGGHSLTNVGHPNQLQPFGDG